MGQCILAGHTQGGGVATGTVNISKHVQLGEDVVHNVSTGFTPKMVIVGYYGNTSGTPTLIAIPGKGLSLPELMRPSDCSAYLTITDGGFVVTCQHSGGSGYASANFDYSAIG